MLYVILNHSYNVLYRCEPNTSNFAGARRFCFCSRLQAATIRHIIRTMADPEITHSEILRDKIFEHLPTQARKTLIGVRVTYWPNNTGEMVLNLEYNALDNCLDIEAKEGIYGPAEKLTGHHVRSCELDAHTAGIHGYSEFMEAAASPTRPID